jgi:two-component system NtrC family sensor kinase
MALSGRLNKFSRTGEMAIIFLAPFLIILGSFLVYFIIRETHRAEEAELAELKEGAKSFYELIAVARFWNAEHGGVYAKVTDTTRPNPYLDVPDRDITSTDGIHYTKVNPAYMTRQFADISAVRQGNTFRLVSRRPLNPANTPDSLEDSLLREVERTGAAQSTLITDPEKGGRSFKYLMPLMIEAPCLACHARQGYRLGDIKGGVAITIPTAKLDAMHSQGTRRTILSLSMLGLISMVATACIIWYLSGRLTREIRKNVKQERLTAAVELAGATAHEMRQPMTVVSIMLDVMKMNLSRSEAVTAEELDTVQVQCDRMNAIIERLLNITDYRTKEYRKGTRILDIEESSREAGQAMEPGKGPTDRAG